MARAVWVLLVGTACAACAGSAQPSPLAATESAQAHPLTELLRAAVRRYQGGVLRGAARGRKSYVWLIADGRGRITGSAASRRPLRTDAVRDVIRERFPDIDTDEWMQRIPETLFPVAGVSRFRPGELGSDTIVVFWADPPTALGSEPPAPHGIFLLGRAAAEQFSPLRVRRAAREAGARQTVWFVEGGRGELLDVGVYDGGRDYDAIRAMLQPRYPGREVQCSAGFALPGANGRWVPTVAVRLGDPR